MKKTDKMLVISGETHNKIKLHCAKTGMKICSVVKNALGEYLDKEASKEASKKKK